MLHPSKVLHALSWSAVRRLRQLSRTPPKRKPAPSAATEQLVEKHGRLCGWLREAVPAGAWAAAKGETVCEIGPGDCIATSALLLGGGARHVDLVEKFPTFLHQKQFEALDKLKSAGVPLDPGIICHDNDISLNPSKATLREAYMEEYTAKENYAMICSLNVGEHVEDLDGFFNSCFRALKKGGWLIHIIDLGATASLRIPCRHWTFKPTRTGFLE
jgi:hypothetical protein